MGLAVTNLEGLTRVRKKLERLRALNFTPLMQEGARILHEDNARRAEAGLDCDDKPMPPTWRERHPDGFWFRRKGGKPVRVKGSREAGSGPPLAPNRKASRVIADTQVSWTTAAPWHSLLRWSGFDTDDGRSILALHAHQQGASHPYPKRDVISHPTPTAVKRFREALRTYVRSMLRSP